MIQKQLAAAGVICLLSAGVCCMILYYDAEGLLFPSGISEVPEEKPLYTYKELGEISDVIVAGVVVSVSDPQPSDGSAKTARSENDSRAEGFASGFLYPEGIISDGLFYTDITVLVDSLYKGGLESDLLTVRSYSNCSDGGASVNENYGWGKT